MFYWKLIFPFFISSELEKDKVRKRVEKAFSAEVARSKEFNPLNPMGEHNSDNQDKPQPNIFRGILKGYQIKGMTWLVNLYDQVSFNNFFKFNIRPKYKFSELII